jgi:hypothetical protein
MKIILFVAVALAVMLTGCIYTTPTITNFQSARVLPDTAAITPGYAMMTKSDQDFGFERHTIEVDISGSKEWKTLFKIPMLMVVGVRILGTVDAAEYDDYVVASGQYLHFIPIKDIVSLGYCWYMGVRLRDAPEGESDTFGTTNHFNFEACLTMPITKKLDITLIPKYILAWNTGVYAAINVGAGIGGTINRGKFVIRPVGGYLHNLNGDDHHFAFGVGVTFYPRDPQLNLKDLD